MSTMNDQPDPKDVPFLGIKWISETDDDYVGRCPFCGDSQKSSKHAHLYVSKRYPIYHCYRCNAKGFLKDIENLLKESCKKEYVLSIKYQVSKLDVPQILSETRNLIKLYSMFITDQEKEYFRSRTKLKSISDTTIQKFALFPDYYARSFLYNNIFKKLPRDCYRTWTMRGFGTGVSGRAHEKNDHILRYVNGDLQLPWSSYVQTDTYFIHSYPIQQYGKMIPTNLVIAEGIYDIVPLYLHRGKYGINDKDTVFMAAQCSAYDRCLTVYRMMYNTLPQNITIFADVGIGLDKLRSQFGAYTNRGRNIVANWPMYKDWEECGPSVQSISI